MRLKLFSWFDVLIVADAEQIRWLNDHPEIVRPPSDKGGWFARFVNQRTLSDLAFDGSPLPVFKPRTDEPRQARQAELMRTLDGVAPTVQGPSDWLGEFVAGVGAGSQADADAMGVVVQQWCGQLLSPEYRATRETYAAGVLIANWPAMPPWKTLGSGAKRKLSAAKERVLAAAGRDLHVVHATSIGMKNLAQTVLKMRELAERNGVFSCSVEDALRAALKVPPLVVRGATGEVQAPFLSSPLKPNTVVVLLLARAYAKSGDMRIAFLEDTWSGCPSRRVVPALLRSVWAAAQELHSERASDQRKPGQIRTNGWSPARSALKLMSGATGGAKSKRPVHQYN
jgi:hypothetical protein